MKPVPFWSRQIDSSARRLGSIWNKMIEPRWNSRNRKDVDELLQFLRWPLARRPSPIDARDPLPPFGHDCFPATCLNTLTIWSARRSLRLVLVESLRTICCED